MNINADTRKSQEKAPHLFDSYSSLYGQDKQQQQQNKNTFHTWHYTVHIRPCNFQYKTNILLES